MAFVPSDEQIDQNISIVRNTMNTNICKELFQFAGGEHVEERFVGLLLLQGMFVHAFQRIDTVFQVGSQTIANNRSLSPSNFFKVGLRDLDNVYSQFALKVLDEVIWSLCIVAILESEHLPQNVGPCFPQHVFYVFSLD